MFKESRKILALFLINLSFSGYVCAFQSGVIVVEPLDAPIVVDGSPSDWLSDPKGPNKDSAEKPVTIPSFVTNPDEMKYNKGWSPEPTIRAGAFENTLYMLVRWKDESPDTLFRPWQNMGTRWRRGRQKDDMFAVRFELNGELAACMLSGHNYSVDVWRWTAGRSNTEGYADDMRHEFGTRFREKSAEYQYNGKPIYISTDIDEGTRGWSYTDKPKTKQGDVAFGISHQTPTGSVADVKAKGVWKDGEWILELSRPFKTDDAEDVVFTKDTKINAQFAFFNAGYRLRKQITESILFDFNQTR